MNNYKETAVVNVSKEQYAYLIVMGLLLGLVTMLFVILFGIANLLPDAIEAIDDTREWLKKRREEKDGAERK